MSNANAVNKKMHAMLIAKSLSDPRTREAVTPNDLELAFEYIGEPNELNININTKVIKNAKDKADFVDLMEQFLTTVSGFNAVTQKDLGLALQYARELGLSEKIARLERAIIDKKISNETNKRIANAKAAHQSELARREAQKIANAIMFSSVRSIPTEIPIKPKEKINSATTRNERLRKAVLRYTGKGHGRRTYKRRYTQRHKTRRN